MPRKSKFDHMQLATPVERPAPPAELSSDEGIEWIGLVNSMPIGFFTREMHPMLVKLCRAITRSRLVSEKLASYTKEMLDDDKSFDRYVELTKIAQQDDRLILQASTKLKLLPSTRHARSLDTRIRKQQVSPSAKLLSAI